MPNRINGQKFPDRLKTKKWIGTASTAGATTSSSTYVKLGSVRVDNVFTASEVLTVTSMVTKTGINGTCSLHLYYNNTDDLTTPTSLGFYRTNNVNGITFLFQRRLAISGVTGSGNGTIVMRNTTNAINDLMPSSNGHGATAGGFIYSPIDWTTEGYIIIAGQTGQPTDFLKFISLQISN
jgi:hypothetical protein